MAKFRIKPKRKGGGVPNAAQDRDAVSPLARSGRFGFAAAFILSCTGLYAALFALPDPCLAVFNRHTARALGYVLNTLGTAVAVPGDEVWGRGLRVKIIPECTPLLMAGVFLCFVAFHPAPARKKAGGLLVGIPALYAGNLARLVLVFTAGRYDRRLFDVLHTYLGQVFTIALVVLSCLVWLRWLDRGDAKRGFPLRIAAFLARFAIISSLLFFLWMEIHHGYIRVVDRFMALGFSLLGYRLSISRGVSIYYETFNVVTFVSLILAARSVPWSRRIKGGVAGMGLLFLFHLLHRIDNVFIASFHLAWVIRMDYVLSAVGQYLLPLLFFLAVARAKTSPRASTDHDQSAPSPSP